MSPRAQASSLSSRPARNAVNNVRAGQILWLRKEEGIDPQLLVGVGLDSECYNHPVVVLFADPSRREATVFILVSIGGRGLLGKHPTIRRFYLAVSPNSHPDNEIQLRLANGMELRKPSYINTEVRYRINWGALEPYSRDRKEYKLDKTSYSLLCTHVGYNSQTVDIASPSDTRENAASHHQTVVAQPKTSQFKPNHVVPHRLQQDDHTEVAAPSERPDTEVMGFIVMLILGVVSIAVVNGLARFAKMVWGMALVGWTSLNAALAWFGILPRPN